MQVSRRKTEKQLFAMQKSLTALLSLTFSSEEEISASI
jgi:hypothetical protein